MASKTKNYLLSTLDTVRRGGDQPPWWNMGAVVAGIVFFFVFAWQYLADTGQPTEPPAAAPPAATAPTNPASPAAPTTAPGTPAPTSTTPDQVGGQVSVPDVSNTPVLVPRAAYQVAQQAFAGLYDPQVAPLVPMAAGETFPTPPAGYPHVIYSGLRVQAKSGDRVAFVGSADPDGTGRQAADVHQLVVVLEDGSWKFTATHP